MIETVHFQVRVGRASIVAVLYARVFIVTVLVAALAPLVGCASRGPTLHANLSTPEMHERMAAHFEPGMTRGQVEAELDVLKQRADRRIWRDEPPAMLARVYEPGGFWVTETHDYVELYDLVFNFDGSLTLVDWTATPFTLRYDYGRPYQWEGGPPRGFPLEPLPPKEWR